SCRHQRHRPGCGGRYGARRGHARGPRARRIPGSESGSRGDRASPGDEGRRAGAVPPGSVHGRSRGPWIVREETRRGGAASRPGVHGGGRSPGAVHARNHSEEGMTMARKFTVAFMAGALCFHGGAAVAAAAYKIVTANEKGTYFAIGADLAKFVAPDATITLEVLPTAGSAANIKH